MSDEHHKFFKFQLIYYIDYLLSIHHVEAAVGA